MLLRDREKKLPALAIWLAKSAQSGRSALTWIVVVGALLTVTPLTVAMSMYSVPYESVWTLNGWPLLAIGEAPRGWISIGAVPVGFLAIGGLAVGVFAFGAVALGFVAVGALSAGVVALSAVAVGWLAGNGVALGWYSDGNVALGAYATGRRAYGVVMAQARPMHIPSKYKNYVPANVVARWKGVERLLRERKRHAE